jgi:hypothetical protein
MAACRALHLCLPNEDNLGDAIACEIVEPSFRKYGVDLRCDRVDVVDLKRHGRVLDDKFDEMNDRYDVVIVGAGGLLSLGLIEFIFDDPGIWERFRIPIIFFGAGAILNRGAPESYPGVDADADLHLPRALRAASVVSVRDLRSWLLAARLSGKGSDRLFLTGCPTIYAVRAGADQRQVGFDLALNPPLTHGVCGQYREQLLQVANAVIRRTKRLRWVCHSSVEERHAKEILAQTVRNFDVCTPRNAEEAARAYAPCRAALVTKAHAGWFCLANNVPFAFLSYDMKCDALLEMLTDFPDRFLCHVDSLPGIDIGKRVRDLLKSLVANDDRMR